MSEREREISAEFGQREGVSRAVLYRGWPGRAILIDALEHTRERGRGGESCFCGAKARWRVARTWGLVPGMGMDCKRDSAAGAEEEEEDTVREALSGRDNRDGLVCPEGLKLLLSVSSGF